MLSGSNKLGELSACSYQFGFTEYEHLSLIYKYVQS